MAVVVVQLGLQLHHLICLQQLPTEAEFILKTLPSVTKECTYDANDANKNNVCGDCALGYGAGVYVV